MNKLEKNATYGKTQWACDVTTLTGVFFLSFKSSWKLRKRLILHHLKGAGTHPGAHIPRALPEYALLLRSKTF